MKVTDDRLLRSLLSECGRQSDFYHRKGDSTLAEFWSELEAVAWDARRRGRGIAIVPDDGGPSGATKGEDLPKTPIPIKACEQGQQPRNHNIIKAFQ